MGRELDIDTWETLSAYLDGALDAVSAAMVERAARTDPETGEALAALMRQGSQLRSWAATVDARPVPPGVRALLAAARSSSNGTDACSPR